MNNTVDVIIPVHNPTSALEMVVNNIFMQSNVNVNVIMVDDASQSGLDILEKIGSKKNVRLYVHQKNKGGGHARNTALNYVESDYVAFCDADDYWIPGKLDEQIKFMEEMRLQMSHSDIVPVGYDGETRERVPTPKKIDLRQYLMTTQLFCSTVCVRSSVIRDIKFGTMRKRHPFKFWVSILESGVTSHRVPNFNCYTQYSIREGSVSANRYTTMIYTILAYLRYPKNKCLAIYCLILRLFLSYNSRSRILGKM